MDPTPRRFRVVCGALVARLQKEKKKAEKEGMPPELWLVLFYADWCPHCQSFVPEFHERGLALQRAGRQDSFGLGALDCAAYGKFCEAWGIHILGLPDDVLYRHSFFLPIQ